MKRIKKIASLLLAMVMALAMTMTAFAAPQTVDAGKGGDGTIHISNATKDVTYTVYKVFDATYADGKIAYSWPNADTWENNAYFTRDTAGNVSATDAAYKAGSKDELSEDAIQWIEANGTKVAETVATDESLTFTGLEYGYYFVTSTLKPNGTITVTSTNPSAEIIDKNQNPSWNEDEKKIVLIDSDGNETKTIYSDNAFGDAVTFEIGVNATNYFNDEKVVEYFVTDKLGEGLKYNKDSIAVKVGDTSITSPAYTIQWGDDTDNPRSFRISIPWIKAEADKTEADQDFLYDATTKITVRYTATVENNAVIAGEGNLNTANFDFRTTKDNPKDPDDPTPWHEFEEKTTTTYTYALGIQKTDAEGNALPGAEFTIAGLGGVETAEGSGIYNYTADTTAEGYTTQFKTGSTGQLIIKGVTVGEYEVTEAVAPEGYNMLTGPVTVEAQRDSETSVTNKESHTFWYDADGNLVKEEVTDAESETYTFPVNVTAVAIVNKAGSLLPSTGGIGTTIFYVVGGILVAAAGILLVTKKRMSVR